MRFLLSLLAVASLATAVLTACNSASLQTNRQQAQNTSSTAANKAADNAHSADDGHGHSEDKAARISLEDAKKAFDGGNAVFVDTRAAVSYSGKHIKGALNIPAEEFQTRYAEVPKDKQIITYCS